MKWYSLLSRMPSFACAFMGVMLMFASCSSDEVQGDEVALDSLADKAIAMTDSVIGTEPVDTFLTLSPQQADSLYFRLSHHYSLSLQYYLEMIH